jgi:hypothetical protein
MKGQLMKTWTSKLTVAAAALVIGAAGFGSAHAAPVVGAGFTAGATGAPIVEARYSHHHGGRMAYGGHFHGGRFHHHHHHGFDGGWPLALALGLPLLYGTYAYEHDPYDYYDDRW